MQPKKLPAKSLLEEYFSYDKYTGVVTLLKRTSQRTPAGSVVGSKNTSGYLKVSLLGESYPIHRLVWKLVTGADPDNIDHINRDRCDNRWENLRSVTSQQNSLNRECKGYTKLPNGTYRVTLQGEDIGYFKCQTAAKVNYELVRERVFRGDSL